jgi:hypothetical protein
MISSINDRQSSFKDPVKAARLKELEKIYNFDEISHTASTVTHNNNNHPTNNMMMIGKPPLNAS